MTDCEVIPCDKRVNTGPVKFGKDWPGFFVRGDEALAFSEFLENAAKLSWPPYSTELLRWAQEFKRCQA